MTNPKEILESVFLSKMSFLICSYLTDYVTNNIRREYYDNCGYESIECLENNKGVFFSSDSGLSTVAYHPEYFIKLCAQKGVRVDSVALGNIGVAYYLIR